MHYQKVIFETRFAHFKYLEYSSTVLDLKALVSALVEKHSDSEVLVAFGPQLSQRYFSGAVPESFSAFSTINGAKEFPATQRDLFVWIQAETQGALFDRTMKMHASVGAQAQLELEQEGFVYHDSRDLTGFIDGSANPQAQAAIDAAIITAGPAAGGSIVMTQQWNHQLDAFAQLTLHQQECVIGRTKQDSIEFDAQHMPSDSHVSKTDISGTKILRRSTPFGGVAEHGLYFLAFSCQQKRFEQLLQSMAGSPQLEHSSDKLMDYSTPVSGSFFYCPAVAELHKFLEQ